MLKIPWILHVNGNPEALNFLDTRSTSESEDPFGATVEIDAKGLIVVGTTRVTDVRQETTDDN
jgi:hypothetical protein